MSSIGGPLPRDSLYGAAPRCAAGGGKFDTSAVTATNDRLCLEIVTHSLLCNVGYPRDRRQKILKSPVRQSLERRKLHGRRFGERKHCFPPFCFTVRRRRSFFQHEYASSSSDGDVLERTSQGGSKLWWWFCQLAGLGKAVGDGAALGLFRGFPPQVVSALTRRLRVEEKPKPPRRRAERGLGRPSPEAYGLALLCLHDG